MNYKMRITGALLISLVLLASLVNFSVATLGTDISSATSIDTFSCLAANGYTFVIIRCWCSFGGTDPNCPHSIYNAWDGGMSDVDAYIFPCAGQSASSQVDQTIQYLQSYQCKYGMIWFDIETNPSPGCGWSEDLSSNCDYMGQLLQAAVAAGASPGVYASEYMWSIIMGSGCTVAANYPLWYADYDQSPSFSGFQSFGGWSSPAIKQYNTGSLCGIGVDFDYYP
eukprot:TRINITY_DN14815_c0_g1_i1.p1 TRINITY_DN14815_c0_g1~~TRINITY_DN14815_c0_g1_i1.p1  ORF type:complete len:225 (-),score=26.52 TRINITY_DN14815_c0_g1_i1:79-753(-)